jgi:transcriptional regulator with XRE-family HTH domain
MPTHRSLAIQLFEHRKAKGLTVRDAADAAGVSSTCYQRTETGNTPDLKILHKFLKWLGTPVSIEGVNITYDTGKKTN